LLLSRSTIERKRTPAELRAFVHEVRAAVREDFREYRLGLRRVGLFKQFLEELVPLSLFAVLAYPDDYKVRPVLGSQGYDALVYDASGRLLECIELALPHDGKRTASDERLVAQRGFGTIHTGSPGQDIADLVPLVLATCESKSRKDYGDCTLVVAVEPLAPFAEFEADFESTLAGLAGRMRELDYRAKRVFLLVMPDRLVTVHAGQDS